MSTMTQTLEALPELEGAAPLWRGVYPLGERETEAYFEDLAEYAVGGGGRGGGRMGAVAGAAARAALAGASADARSGVPLGQLGIPGEGEWEAGTLAVPSPASVMEHLGHVAASAASEAEAEAYVGAMVPLAARVHPRAAPTIMRVAPQLVRGTSRIARTLYRSPSTRPLLRVVPTIVRRTGLDVARAVDQGIPVTPQLVGRMLAREAQRTLRTPDTAVRAYQQSRRLDRHFHVAIQGRVFEP